MPNEHVSLEVAKKLKEAGWRGETEYCHREDGYGLVFTEDVEDSDDWMNGCFIYAPTATQLAEELPHGFSLGKTETGNPFCSFETITIQHGIESETFPDALGLLVVYLLENGLMNK